MKDINVDFSNIIRLIISYVTHPRRYKWFSTLSTHSICSHKTFEIKQYEKVQRNYFLSPNM